MKLSEIEKREMLEDGRDKKRMMDFRKMKYDPKMSFEEYVSWLDGMQLIDSVRPKKKFVVYKNVKI